MERYYHITPKENALSIQMDGLNANEDGEIFIFTVWDLTDRASGSRVILGDLIAVNQVFIDEYLLVEIDPQGIKGELFEDNVAELTAPYQKIVRQKKIAKKYCKVIGTRKVDSNAVKEFNGNILREATKIEPPRLP